MQEELFLLKVGLMKKAAGGASSKESRVPRQGQPDVGFHSGKLNIFSSSLNRGLDEHIVPFSFTSLYSLAFALKLGIFPHSCVIYFLFITQ